jgi:hypothetical protein
MSSTQFCPQWIIPENVLYLVYAEKSQNNNLSFIHKSDFGHLLTFRKDAGLAPLQNNFFNNTSSFVLYLRSADAFEGGLTLERHNFVSNRQNKNLKALLRIWNAVANAASCIFIDNTYSEGLLSAGDTVSAITGGYFYGNAISGKADSAGPTPTHNFGLNLNGFCDFHSVMSRPSPEAAPSDYR